MTDLQLFGALVIFSLIFGLLGTYMKPGRGKEKGSSFEREVGKKISLWLSGGQRSDLICRTVLSGGQFTVTGGGNAGDLMAQHPLAFAFFEHFVLECKHWKDVHLIRFLVRDGDLYKEFEKVKKQAAKQGKCYLYVVRQNHQKIILFMSIEAIRHFTFKVEEYKNYHILFGGEVYMYYFDDFLANVKSELWEV